MLPIHGIDSITDMLSMYVHSTIKRPIGVCELTEFPSHSKNKLLCHHHLSGAIWLKVSKPSGSIGNM